jgi:hypothetical protein
MAALAATDPRLFLSDVTTGHGERLGHARGNRIVAGAVSAVTLPLPEPDNAGGVELVFWQEPAV